MLLREIHNPPEKTPGLPTIGLGQGSRSTPILIFPLLIEVTDVFTSRFRVH